ncbi:hypothetical protein RHS03_06610, partial [Rhizoctonia solani]
MLYQHMKTAKEARAQAPPSVDTSSNEDDHSNDIEMDPLPPQEEFQDSQDADNHMDFDWQSTHTHLDDNTQSNQSWENIETLLPSPPQSTLLGASDEEFDKNKDRFMDITKEDCWFREEWEKLDKIHNFNLVADTLTEEEMDSFKMLAIHLFGHILQRNYEQIQYSFKEKLHLLSTYCLHKKLAQLYGIKPVTVDCCINVCHAFTEQYAEETCCSTCKQQQFDAKGKPQQVFEYLPTTPCFQGYFNNPDMVQQMEFWANYVHQEGAMDKVFDGTQYLDLCETPIVVEGKPQGVSYFNKKTGQQDIAYSIMLDGVTIRKKAAKGNSSCWPIMGQNLNLPASKQAKLWNLIPIGVILGPRQPKDFNLFLVPLVEEALEQPHGVWTFDITTGHHFILRAHPIMVSGNMQAIKHVMEMKGTNARCPCHACHLHGIWLEPAKTYYIPLANPCNNHDIIPDKRIVPKLDPIDTWFDPLGLPLCMHKGIQEQLQLMDAAQTKKEYNRIAMECGLTSHSILDQIPLIQCPDLYLHEFMHLFLLNYGLDLVSLQTGMYKGLGMDAGMGTFILPFLEWCKVGHEAEAATKTIAAPIIQPFPNIQTHIKCYISEHWAFWLIYIGPVVLQGWLPKKYYNHYLELVNIMKCLLSINNTTAQIEALHEKIAAYAERFEELYYQYDYEQLRMCKSVVHALLHAPNNVLCCRPVWGYWSWLLKRYCQEVTACAKSKVLPWTGIARYVLQMSQLSAVACCFPELQKAMLFGKSSTPVNVTQMEEIKPGYKERILRFPCLCKYFLKPNLCWPIAQYFYTNFPVCSFHEWLEFIPEHCKHWGKVCIQNAKDTGPGDYIQSAVATNPFSPYGKHNASFVKHKLHVLAHITEAEGAEGDAASKMIAVTKFGQSIILDISLVMNLAGRVFTCGVVATGEWILIDQGKAIQQTAFDIPKEAEEEEVDDVDN